MKKGILLLLLVCLMLALTACGCKHEQTELRNVVEATCTQAGYSGDTVCVECQEIMTKGAETPMTEHYTRLADETAADCVSDGYTGDTVCVNCNAVLEQGAAVPALGHEPGDRRNVREATCTDEGKTGEVVCLRCYEVLEENQTVPALGHTLGEAYGVVEPTCLSDGYTGDQDCSVCGKTMKGEVAPKLAHDYVDYVCVNCGWMEPGLYAEGQRLMTWDQLVSGGYVRLKGDSGYWMEYIADSLYGTLVIDECVGQLGSSDPLCPDGVSKLECVYIPASVEGINAEAFQNCISLREVKFFGAPAIENFAFDGCVSLEHVELPEGVNAVRSWAFRGCVSLKSVTLPSTLKLIGVCAFEDCASLESIDLPEGLEIIEQYAFSGTGLHELILPSTVTEFGALSDENPLFNLKTLDMSKAQITLQKAYIGRCPELKTLILPDVLTEIWGNKLSDLYSLEEIEFPEGFTTLGELFFPPENVDGNASQIKRVIWPASLLDGSGLVNCVNLEEICYRGSEMQWNLTLSKDLFTDVNVIFDYKD